MLFEISYKDQDTNFLTLHLEYLIASHCMRGLGKYHGDAHEIY